MIFQFWDFCFVILIILCLGVGVLKGFLRTLTLLSAQLFSLSLALVLSPSLTEQFNRYMEGNLATHYPSFLLIYLLPMILLTQLFRVMYKRNIQKNGKHISLSGRWGGLLTGSLLGAFFCFFLTWNLLLQPLLPLDTVYSMGGVVFNHTARILQIFMRFYV